MKKGINVLSCFDGMSCGQIALERAGIKVNEYYASEIDKYAIKVTMTNYPNTIQLGSVTDLDDFVLETVLPKIDLIIGGSPCQGFSFAGKQLNFEDPRSKLFFEYVRLLNVLRKTNPDIKFLLENVKMTKESQDVISRYLGVEPILINSSLVSGQNRNRLYWTNIADVAQPLDRGVLLQDILEKSGLGVIKNRGELAERNEKAMCLDANYFKGVDNHGQRTMFVRATVQANAEHTLNGKCPTLTAAAGMGGGNVPLYSTSEIGLKYKGKYIDASERRSFNKLTPVECERLQTVPDNYTSSVSNSQRYKMLGNGWTVNVVAHILSSWKQN